MRQVIIDNTTAVSPQLQDHVVRYTNNSSPPRPVDTYPAYVPAHSAVADQYFDSSMNVFYRPTRDVDLAKIAAQPMGTLDWGLVPEDEERQNRSAFEIDELAVAAILERHPCGDSMTNILNTSRSLPVGVHHRPSAYSASKGNFSRALEVAERAGGSAGASHALLYSKGGPERKPNVAEAKWGPVKFSDMGTVALGAKITRDVLELRRAFSKRDAIVNFPDFVTPEALAFVASRFGPNWEMFDIAQHADQDSAVMRVFLDRHSSTTARKALSHGSETTSVSYTKEGHPVWHRQAPDKALLSGAFRVADDTEKPLVGPLDGPDSNLAAEANLPLPPMPPRPKGWPKDGPGHPPPTSQEGLRQKRFKLEDRVPVLKEFLERDEKAKAVGPPQVAVGTAQLIAAQRERASHMSRNRLPVWRALKSPPRGEGDAFGASPIVTADERRALQAELNNPAPSLGPSGGGGGAGVGTNAASRAVAEQRSAPRTRSGAQTMYRLKSSVGTPAPRPDDPQPNAPLVLRSNAIVEDRHKLLRQVERKVDARGRIITGETPEHKVGEAAAQNTKQLGLLLSPPPVPFSDVRRSHTAPMLPWLAVSGVPQFDAITATADQSTAWKQLLNEI